MRFLRQSLTGLFLVSVTLGLMTYAGAMIYTEVEARLSEEPKTAPRRERMFAVNVITATPQQITPELTAFGEVQSLKSLEIRAKSGGTLVELSEDFEDGMRVSAGQLLARIDPADSISAFDRAASDLLDAQAERRDARRALDIARDERAAAQAQADLQERAFKRQQDLEARGVGTAAAVETAELALAQARQAVLSRRQALADAEARIDQAETGLARATISRDEAQRRVDDTRITAAFGGALTDVTALQGGLVSANERLGVLIDPATLEVAFRISTPQFSRLLDSRGQLVKAPVSVTLEAFGVDLVATGRITRASASVGEGQTGRLVFAALDAAQGLKPGDFVTLRVKEPPLDNVVRLPATAMGSEGNVLALGADDRLETIAVTLMRRQGDDILVTGQGLATREIVTQRSPLLGAGIKVRPLRPGAPGARADAPQMLELSADRRARLVAYVQSNADMPEAVKTRLLSELEQDRVPAGVVQRLENRMGG